jgi:hypothetical protein
MKMSATVLQINFKFNVSPGELAEAFAPLAEPIAEVPGLRWKIWSLNEDTSEFAGIYLFDDQASVQAYLEGPIIAQVSAHPALSDISAKQFGVVAEFSAITRGPVELTIAPEPAKRDKPSEDRGFEFLSGLGPDEP